MEELSATLTQLLQSQQLFQASFSTSIKNLTSEFHHLRSLIPPSDFSSSITPHVPDNHHQHTTPNPCWCSPTPFSQQSASVSDPFMIEIVKSKLNDVEDPKLKPLQLQQGESVNEQSSGMEEGFCDSNKHYSSPVIGDLDFTVLGDDNEESSFHSSSMDPDDIIIPTKQLKVSSLLFNDEHLVEKNDDAGLSAPIVTQALVPISTPSSFGSELAVGNMDIVKYEFKVNVISDLSPYVRDRLKMNLDPLKWLADGSNIEYFHDDDYEIPPKPPDVISKIERGCTPEVRTRVCRYTIFPPSLQFSFSPMTMILTRNQAEHLSTKVATTRGTVVAYVLVPKRSIGPNSWKIVAALMGRHIGGVVNYVAIFDTFGVQSSAAGLTAYNVIHNIICALCFSTLFALASKVPPETSSSVNDEAKFPVVQIEELIYKSVSFVSKVRKIISWDPGGQLKMCIKAWFFTFKQWDPERKFVVGVIFTTLRTRWFSRWVECNEWFRPKSISPLVFGRI